jgi:tripartite ATP-independent transporter DctP family solute receptor
MPHRRHAKFLLIAAAVALSLSAPSAPAQPKKIVMKFGDLAAVDSAVHQGALKFAELVAQRTGGQAEVQIFPNSQLGNAKSQLQALSIGGQEFFMDGIGWYVDYDKDWTPLALGFAIKNDTDLLRVLDSEVGRELESKLQLKGIRVAAHNWWKGYRSLISRKPIRNLEELKNIKMRVPSRAFFITWQALGTQPTVVAWGETFTALQQGVVDGAEGGLVDLYTQKTYEVAPHITLTRHLVNISALSVSEKLFQSWPPNVQKAVLESAREAGEAQHRFQDVQERAAVEKMKAAGTSFYEPNRDEWMARVSHLPEKLDAQGEWSKGLWARIQAAIKRN